jgi:hypothetical protein
MALIPNFDFNLFSTSAFSPLTAEEYGAGTSFSANTPAPWTDFSLGQLVGLTNPGTTYNPIFTQIPGYNVPIPGMPAGYNVVPNVGGAGSQGGPILPNLPGLPILQGGQGAMSRYLCAQCRAGAFPFGAGYDCSSVCGQAGAGTAPGTPGGAPGTATQPGQAKPPCDPQKDGIWSQITNKCTCPSGKNWLGLCKDPNAKSWFDTIFGFAKGLAITEAVFFALIIIVIIALLFRLAGNTKVVVPAG